jgi:hypothetical protein
MTMSDVGSPDPRPLRNMPMKRPLPGWVVIRGGLRGHRILFLLGLAATIGVWAGWMWFGFGTTVLRPLLYLFPCAAMMVMCMKAHGTSTERAVNPSAPSGNPNPGLSQ